MDMTRHYGTYALWLAFSLAFAGQCFAQGDGGTAQNAGSTVSGDTLQISSGTLLQVELLQDKDWRRIRPNTRVEGRLTLPAYSAGRVAVPAGTTVRLSIASVERVRESRGTWKKVGTAVVRAFNPLENPHPAEYSLKLASAEVISPSGEVTPLHATVLRTGYASMVQAQEPKSARRADALVSGEKAQSKRKPKPLLVLRVDDGLLWAAPKAAEPMNDAAQPANLKTSARAFLLTPLSASHSRKEDAFQARLAEPIRLGDQTFEAGSLLEGRVARSTPPRILSRAGSLRLRFERVTSPQGQSLAVTGTLSGAEEDSHARYVLDEEGGLRGLKPGAAQALVDLGIAYALGKATDDIAETPIRAVGAAMSDAAVANAARYFGIAGSAAFLVTRHGRDVRLPQYAEIEIQFGRSQPAPQTASNPE